MAKSIEELAKVDPERAVQLLMESGESRRSAEIIVALARGDDLRDLILYDEDGVAHPQPPWPGEAGVGRRESPSPDSRRPTPDELDD